VLQTGGVVHVNVVVVVVVVVVVLLLYGPKRMLP
jgi:hypothetical protein